MAAKGEAVPRYTVELAPDGQTININVWLPGLEDGNMNCELLFDQLFLVHAPGRFRAEIPLPVPALAPAEVLRFVKKKARLKAVLRVQQKQPEPAAAASGGSSDDELPPLVPDEDVGPAAVGACGSAGAGRTGAPPAGAANGHAAPCKPATQAPQQQQPQKPQQPGGGGGGGAAAGGQGAAAAAGAQGDMYAEARRQANRDAAEDCLRLARQAERSGDLPRAVRLLQKACSLVPGQYEAELEAASRKVPTAAARAKSGGGGGGGAAGGAAGGSTGGAGAAASAGRAAGGGSEGVSSSTGRGGGGGGAASGAASGRRQQQQQAQQQQRAEAAPGAAPAAATSGAQGGLSWRGRASTILWAMAGLGLVALSACLLFEYSWQPLPAVAAGAAVAAGGGGGGSEGRDGGWWASGLVLARWGWHAATWLPRVLLWQPTFAAVAGYEMGMAGLFCLFPGCEMAFRSVAAKARTIVLLWTFCAYNPVLFLAAGGGWLGLLGFLAQFFLDVKGISEKWGALLHLLGYPVVLFLCRVPARWAAALLGGVPRLLLWAPRWWSHLPLVAAAIFVQGRLDQDAGYLLVTGSIGVLTQWLSRGGWWGVACLGCCGVHVLGAWLEDSHGIRMPLPVELAWKGAMLASPGIVLVRFFWAWSESILWAAGVGISLSGLLAAWIARASSRAGGRRAGSGGGSFFGRTDQQRRRTAGKGPSGPAHLDNEVPAQAPEVVVQVLSAGNYYEVLGVSRECSDSDIRRAKLTLSLATHPDKIGNLPGVNQAFNLVTEAADALGSAERRRAYEARLAELRLEDQMRRRAEESSRGGGGGPFGGFGGRREEGPADDDTSDPGFGLPQPCDACGGFHLLRPVPRHPTAARYCAECNTYHPVGEGEIWFERRSAGWFSYELKMLMCWEGLVWDMTEMGICAGYMRIVRAKDFPFNAHANPIRRPPVDEAGGGRRSRKKKGRRR